MSQLSLFPELRRCRHTGSWIQRRELKDPELAAWNPEQWVCLVSQTGKHDRRNVKPLPGGPRSRCEHGHPDAEWEEEKAA